VWQTVTLTSWAGEARQAQFLQGTYMPFLCLECGEGPTVIGAWRAFSMLTVSFVCHITGSEYQCSSCL